MATVVRQETVSGALETMGQRVRRCRGLRGWTQTELADRAGLDQTTVSAVETGIRGMQMSIETCWRLAFALGVSADMLIGLPEMRG